MAGTSIKNLGGSGAIDVVEEIIEAGGPTGLEVTKDLTIAGLTTAELIEGVGLLMTGNLPLMLYGGVVLLSNLLGGDAGLITGNFPVTPPSPTGPPAIPPPPTLPPSTTFDPFDVLPPGQPPGDPGPPSLRVPPPPGIECDLPPDDVNITGDDRLLGGILQQAIDSGSTEVETLAQYAPQSVRMAMEGSVHEVFDQRLEQLRADFSAQPPRYREIIEVPTTLVSPELLRTQPIPLQQSIALMLQPPEEERAAFADPWQRGEVQAPQAQINEAITEYFQKWSVGKYYAGPKLKLKATAPASPWDYPYYQYTGPTLEPIPAKPTPSPLMLSMPSLLAMAPSKQRKFESDIFGYDPAEGGLPGGAPRKKRYAPSWIQQRKKEHKDVVEYVNEALSRDPDEEDLEMMEDTMSNSNLLRAHSLLNFYEMQRIEDERKRPKVSKSLKKVFPKRVPSKLLTEEQLKERKEKKAQILEEKKARGKVYDLAEFLLASTERGEPVLPQHIEMFQRFSDEQIGWFEEYLFGDAQVLHSFYDLVTSAERKEAYESFDAQHPVTLPPQRELPPTPFTKVPELIKRLAEGSVTFEDLESRDLKTLFLIDQIAKDKLGTNPWFQYVDQKITFFDNFMINSGIPGKGLIRRKTDTRSLETQEEQLLTLLTDEDLTRFISQTRRPTGTPIQKARFYQKRARALLELQRRKVPKQLAELSGKLRLTQQEKFIKEQLEKISKTLIRPRSTEELEAFAQQKEFERGRALRLERIRKGLKSAITPIEHEIQQAEHFGASISEVGIPRLDALKRRRDSLDRSIAKTKKELLEKSLSEEGKANLNVRLDGLKERKERLEEDITKEKQVPQLKKEIKSRYAQIEAVEDIITYVKREALKLQEQVRRGELKAFLKKRYTELILSQKRTVLEKNLLERAREEIKRKERIAELEGKKAWFAKTRTKRIQKKIEEDLFRIPSKKLEEYKKLSLLEIKVELKRREKEIKYLTTQIGAVTAFAQTKAFPLAQELLVKGTVLFKLPIPISKKRQKKRIEEGKEYKPETLALTRKVRGATKRSSLQVERTLHQVELEQALEAFRGELPQMYRMMLRRLEERTSLVSQAGGIGEDVPPSFRLLFPKDIVPALLSKEKTLSLKQSLFLQREWEKLGIYAEFRPTEKLQELYRRRTKLLSREVRMPFSSEAGKMARKEKVDELLFNVLHVGPTAREFRRERRERRRAWFGKIARGYNTVIDLWLENITPLNILPGFDGTFIKKIRTSKTEKKAGIPFEKSIWFKNLPPQEGERPSELEMERLSEAWNNWFARSAAPHFTTLGPRWASAAKRAEEKSKKILEEDFEAEQRRKRMILREIQLAKQELQPKKTIRDLRKIPLSITPTSISRIIKDLVKRETGKSFFELNKRAILRDIGTILEPAEISLPTQLVPPTPLVPLALPTPSVPTIHPGQIIPLVPERPISLDLRIPTELIQSSFQDDPDITPLMFRLPRSSFLNIERNEPLEYATLQPVPRIITTPSIDEPLIGPLIDPSIFEAIGLETVSETETETETETGTETEAELSEFETFKREFIREALGEDPTEKKKKKKRRKKKQAKKVGPRVPITLEDELYWDTPKRKKGVVEEDEPTSFAEGVEVSETETATSETPAVEFEPYTATSESDVGGIIPTVSIDSLSGQQISNLPPAVKTTLFTEFGRRGAGQRGTADPGSGSETETESEEERFQEIETATTDTTDTEDELDNIEKENKNKKIEDLKKQFDNIEKGIKGKGWGSKPKKEESDDDDIELEYRPTFPWERPDTDPDPDGEPDDEPASGLTVRRPRSKLKIAKIAGVSLVGTAVAVGVVAASTIIAGKLIKKVIGGGDHKDEKPPEDPGDDPILPIKPIKPDSIKKLMTSGNCESNFNCVFDPQKFAENINKGLL